MALTKVSRGLLSTGIVDNSNATAITLNADESATFSGSVGIGTSSTTANKFTVSGDSVDGSQSRIIGSTNENYQLRLGFDTSNLVGKIQAIHVGTAYKNLSLQPDGGNAGIGTSSPDSLLHVSGVANLRIGYNGTSANYMDADTNIFRSGNGTERMRISSTGEIFRTTQNNALDDSITTLRHVNDSNAFRASCQCDVIYSTEHVGHNTTLWLSVLTPQASANWDAGGSATMKLTWSGFHASGVSMAKWDCVFGNNHYGAFRWARSAVSMLEAPDSYYGYTPGVEFYRQTADGNGFTGNATTMRVLWIKITGNAASNVCPTRTLEISGVVGGPAMKYVVAHGGYTTPTNISAIGASV